ncbi:MAG: PEP-CTERM sorting domain-containing protein [Colwellia sp.]|nr:PEP-CTERM sorting domain-containing protein [Colwellia sp.]
MKFLNTAFITLLLLTTVIVNVANAGLILEEDFDPITSANWTLSNGSVLGNPASEFYSQNALHFNGSGTRSATTNSFDMTTGGMLSFMLKIGGSNDTALFEDADAGEDVLIQYATNGGSWINLVVIDTEDAIYKDTWGMVNLSFSGSAMTNNTKFQWIQASHSGNNWDNWAIDNVSLSNNVNVPEPTTFAIFALGIIGLASRRFKKKS